MQLTAFLPFVAFLTATEAAISCNGAGSPSWDDRNDAKYHIGRACRGYDGKKGALQGVFPANGIKGFCYQKTNIRYGIQIQNLNTRQSFNLDDNHCAEGLQAIVNACQRGGSQTIAGWEYQ
ncbi:hypothetical protein QBC36DRAFT_311641 [Triangularia setosa]|uniref:Secreted protein n=1 Tax=Triangularia setosa TaxID=2587417 RepID=A0AAN6W5N8_9PEZI|nr:hypothetical protein QBC36DRAFT_311641 [Podospora setosa]